MTTIAGCSVVATEHAVLTSRSDDPVSTTMVVSRSWLIRCRTVWVLPTPGGP